MKKSIIVSFILCFSLLKTYTQVLSGYGIVASYNAFQYSQEKSPLLFDPIANMGVGLYGDWLKNKNFKLRTQVSYIQRATNIAYLPPYGTNINPTTGLVNGDVMEYQQLNSNLAIDLDFKANILVKKIKPFILIGVRQLYCLSTQLNKTQTWSNDFTYVYFGKQDGKFNFDVSAAIGCNFFDWIEISLQNFWGISNVNTFVNPDTGEKANRATVQTFTINIGCNINNFFKKNK